MSLVSSKLAIKHAFHRFNSTQPCIFPSFRKELDISIAHRMVSFLLLHERVLLLTIRVPGKQLHEQWQAENPVMRVNAVAREHTQKRRLWASLCLPNSLVPYGWNGTGGCGGE